MSFIKERKCFLIETFLKGSSVLAGGNQIKPNDHIPDWVPVGAAFAGKTLTEQHFPGPAGSDDTHDGNPHHFTMDYLSEIHTTVVETSAMRGKYKYKSSHISWR